MQYKLDNDYPDFPQDYFVVYRKNIFYKWRYVKDDNGWIMMFNYHDATSYIKKHESPKTVHLNDNQLALMLFLLIIGILLLLFIKNIYGA